MSRFATQHEKAICGLLFAIQYYTQRCPAILIKVILKLFALKAKDD